MINWAGWRKRNSPFKKVSMAMRECDIDKVIVPRASEPDHFCTIHVTFSVHYLWIFFVLLNSYCWDFFNNTMWSLELLSASRIMLFFLTFSLSYLLTNYNEERGNKNKNKMTPKTYQSFDENIIGTIEKISTRLIQ